MSAAPAPDTEQDTEALDGTGPASPGKPARSKGRIIINAVLLALCLFWLVPVIGLLISSFRPRDQVLGTGWWTVLANPLEFTQQVTIENYVEVFEAGMGSAFINSFVIAVPSTVIPILAAAFAAYAFSWMRFPGREALFILVIMLLVVPLQVAFVPLLRMFVGMGIQGTFLSIWLAHSTFGMPLAVYLLRNYIGSLPREVVESAKVDGASHFQVFWRLILPLSVPALAAFVIFQFLWTWNDFLVATIFLRPRPLTVELVQLVSQYGAEWHLLMAGSFVTMIVPLIVFFTMQRFFVRGMTAGSVKG
jgi:alpha-glucoside transport system permease protein